MEKLSPEEAQSFLLRRSGHQSVQEDELRAADALARELDYLPLALEQAAAYMVQRGTRFQDYLVSFRKRGLELLERQQPMMGNYSRSAATTWALNFSEVEQTPASADMLRLSAFLAPEDIPLDLLAPGLAQLEGPLAQALKGYKEDPIVVDEVLEPLLRYSLVQRHAGGLPVYSIHRLAQAVIQQNLGLEAERDWAERAVTVLNAAFPSAQFETWPICNRLLSHAQAALGWIERWHLFSDQAARLLNEAGGYLIERGQYRAAEPPFRRALEIREQALGPMHPDTATSLDNMAILLQEKGDQTEAEVLHRRALAIREQVLGPMHRDTATSLNDLASVLQEKGDLTEAEALHRRALEIYEHTFGQTHPDTATSLSHLALLLQEKGDLTGAEALHRRALEIYEQALGPTHPYTATSLNYLALLLQEKGDLTAAEALHRRAREIYEQALGPTHPYTTTSPNHLALLLQRKGNLIAAKPP